MRRTRIVIFAEAPVQGRVKARLIPALGEKGAAELALRMFEDRWRETAAVSVADAELCVDPEPESKTWQALLPRGAPITAQGNGHSGERLSRAAERVTGEGQSVLLIGTDCPALTSRRLTEACRELESHDCVIHPTFGGGYALLGLNRFDPSIFSGIDWSTPSLARAMMGRIKALGWSCHLGATLQNIDGPEDLDTLNRRA